ncbi:MAG: hypothetical protein HY855_02470 [Burkholderiales bacterium]|nr:hypothetical protein [Burkholderiales bacterium]
MLQSLFTGAAIAQGVALLGAAPASAQPKPRIERAADLPRFSYRIEGKLDDILRSPERFAPLAAAIRRDTESVLKGYEIPDRGTQRDLLGLLAAIIVETAERTPDGRRNLMHPRKALAAVQAGPK